LTIGLTGTGSGSFTVAPTTITSIAVNGSDSFTVVPNTGLAAGPHIATVTVSGANGISAGFDVNFEATYGISLSQTAAYTFPEAEFDYSARTPHPVTITNTGNQPTGVLAVALTGAGSSAFTLDPPTTVASIAAGSSGSFTVAPKTGLTAGTHTATVSVTGGNGISASFGVSFEVRLPQTFSGLITHLNGTANSPSASYTLPSGAETYTTALILTTANSPATVVIDGGGRVITGGTNSITVGEGVSLTLTNITFTTLPFTVEAGGTLVLETGAVVRESNGAGVTINDGILEMKDGALVTANGASGVLMDGAGARFTMDGGEISYNIGTRISIENDQHGDEKTMGGGVNVQGGEFTMNGGLISNNSVIHHKPSTFSASGGGVALSGANTVFTMNGGKITENTAESHGGGLAMFGENAVFTMTDGEISWNTGRDGGGLVLWMYVNITFTMSGGSIKNNTATADGGGVYALWGSVFTMTGGEITGNEAKKNGGGAVVSGTLLGDPSIGSKVSGKGSIYGNTPSD
jgi:hypothetical protein